jgi:hypothetical protein
MHGPINVKSPNKTSKWQMGFNSAFKGLILFQGGARSIHTAARYGHVGIINTLLQKGEKVDVTTNVSGELNRTHLLSLS